MPSKEDLKALVCREIDKRSEEIIGLAQEILENPEPGFREFKTSRIVTRKFGELGLKYQDQLAITGVKTIINGSGPGPTVGVLGELDSLIVPDHPFADKITGAAHACGHHCQIAQMYACAAAFSQSGVMQYLGGRVACIAVPAEEYIELEYRDELRRSGKLHYLGGKPEFVKIGALDDVDMVMLDHTSSNPEDKKLAISGTSNGCIAKRIQYIGKSAHAGSAPHRGINALNAAVIALNAINAQRETFRDDDTVRVHPIITKGGDAVNAVPADVRLETFVRGKTIESIRDANIKVDRCLKAGAMACGAKVQITTLPGYLPVVTWPSMQEIYKANAIATVGADQVVQRGHGTASTDMGDLSHIMPTLNVTSGGATGIGHGSDYVIKDWNTAVIAGAKAMAMTVVDLLADGAVKGKEILMKNKPKMTKVEYLAYMDSLLKEELYQG